MPDIKFVRGELKKIYGENQSVADISYTSDRFIFIKVKQKKQFANLKFHFSPYKGVKVIDKSVP